MQLLLRKFNNKHTKYLGLAELLRLLINRPWFVASSHPALRDREPRVLNICALRLRSS